MGTTADAFRSRRGSVLGHSLVIEGYECVLTDGEVKAAVQAAYAGTEWNGATVLRGLAVHGIRTEKLDPWPTAIHVPNITFVVTSDGPADTFGRAVFRSKPTFRTRLTGLYQPAPDGSGTIPVKNTVPFPPSGDVYIGGKRVAYGSKPDGTSFLVAAGQSQVYHPFTAGSGNKYTTPHDIANNYNEDIAPASKVQDAPPTWIGRKVALYAHRIVGGTWDHRDEAELVFAGKIVAIEEDADGNTVLDCDDLRSNINECVLLRNGWKGYVKPGVRLRAGTVFKAHTNVLADSMATLTVVSSGAVGTDQVDEGLYELGAVVSILDRWLANSALPGAWSASLKEIDGPTRFRVGVTYSSDTDRRHTLACTDLNVIEFLGFLDTARQTAFGWSVSSPAGTGGTAHQLVSPGPPYLIKPFQPKFSGTPNYIELESAEGDWIDNTDFLPAPWDAWPDAATENRGFIKIGSSLHFVRYVDDTTIDRVVNAGGFAGFAAGSAPSTVSGRNLAGLTVDDPGEDFVIEQVPILADSFAELVPRLLASTGGGVNHDTYDVFPKAMGCPAIPWSLLGDAFVDSCKGLEQANRTEGAMIVLNGPTKLIDWLVPELAARFAWLTWKDSGYQLVSPPTPSSLTADHVLDESNKAAPSGDRDSLRPRTRITGEHIRNVLTIEYNRTIDGDYRGAITVRNTASIDEHDGPRAQTISLPSSYADSTQTGAPVSDLATSLLLRCLPLFGKDMHTIRRPIAPSLYHMAPGDTVSLTDAFARDRVTGARGMTDRAGIVLEVSLGYSRGAEGQTLYGEAVIWLADEDRTYPLAPCAQVDHSHTVGGFTAGWDSAARTLRLLAHQHSRSTEAVDVSRFSPGDKVRVEEVDPSDPATVQSWDVDVAAAGVDAANNELTVVQDLAGFDTAKRYRVVPQIYSAVTADQRLATFLADEADLLIEDLAQPNLYAEDSIGLGFLRSSPDELARMIGEELGAEGRPLNAGLLYDLMLAANNLWSYKGATRQTVNWANPPDAANLEYQWVAMFPFFVGAAPYKRARRRLTVRPTLRCALGGTSFLRVTSSERKPVGVLHEVSFEDRGGFAQVEFSTTSLTPTVVDAQELDIVMARSGWTYITLELKNTGFAAELHAIDIEEGPVGSA